RARKVRRPSLLNRYLQGVDLNYLRTSDRWIPLPRSPAHLPDFRGGGWCTARSDDGAARTHGPGNVSRIRPYSTTGAWACQTIDRIRAGPSTCCSAEIIWRSRWKCDSEGIAVWILNQDYRSVNVIQ